MMSKYPECTQTESKPSSCTDMGFSGVTCASAMCSLHHAEGTVRVSLQADTKACTNPLSSAKSSWHNDKGKMEQSAHLCSEDAPRELLPDGPGHGLDTHQLVNSPL